MSKTIIALIILAIIIVGFIGWQLSLPFEPQVFHYKQLYNEMSKTEYLQDLRNFCKNELGDSIDGLNYSQLITWEHKYLTYTRNEFARRELPIDILLPYVTDGVAFGRCGEFALCANGLLLANGYKTRLVLDISKSSGDKVAGDHVWLEVWTDNRWVHCDPTEQRFDEPKMYAVDWNKQVNNVIAIWKDASGNMATEDVTKVYE